jgi:acetyl-CoA carboxylase biotin carboxyl carrier protein
MTDEKASDGAMRVDTDLIRQLADLLSEHDLSEIEVEDGDRRIAVKRELTLAAPAPAASAAPHQAVPASPSPPGPPLAPAADDAAGHPGAVRSPMVGTVFLSAEPGAAPFISAGARVEAGDTLLIVEAMKVMNPIPAPRAGTVRQVCVQDAQPVEFDQVLAIVE